jgi:ADP-ribosylglycohydrolase
MFQLTLIAMADAYGAGFEFARFNTAEHNTLTNYLKHNLEGTAAGSYSDDTQMSIAVARAVLAHEEPDAQDFIRSFVETFKADPRETYARGFYLFLCSCVDAADFAARIKPTSNRSGAAMRVGPIGLYADLAKVLRVAEMQARITHDTEEGIASAQVIAASVHYHAHARRHAGAGSLFDFLNAHVPGYEWEKAWQGRTNVDGFPCARAALTAVARNRRYTELLKDCVNFGGDTDTVCAMAAAIAALDPDYERDVPRWMVDNLESGPFGRPLLHDLDQRLMAHYELQLHLPA